MFSRSSPRMEAFIPEINGGVPTNALGSELARKLARQRVEQVLSATPVPPQKSKAVSK